MKTTMRDVIAIHEKIAKMSPEEAFGNSSELLEETDIIGEYMNMMSEKAQHIVTQRVKEEDFVDLVNAMASTLVFGMLTQQGSTGALRLLLSGDMQPFLHTMILAVLGSMIDEEVL